MVVVVADVVLLLLFQNLINRTHCCRDRNIELLTLCTDTHTHTLTPTNTVAATRITLNTAQKNNHQQTPNAPNTLLPFLKGWISACCGLVVFFWFPFATSSFPEAHFLLFFVGLLLIRHFGFPNFVLFWISSSLTQLT